MYGKPIQLYFRRRKTIEETYGRKDFKADRKNQRIFDGS